MRGEVKNSRRRRAEPKVIDLMEALKASVEEAGSKRTRRRSAPRRQKKRSSAA